MSNGYWIKTLKTIQFWNRYQKINRHNRSNWNIIGIVRKWSGHTLYSYRLCFFGFEVRFWIEREWIEENNNIDGVAKNE